MTNEEDIVETKEKRLCHRCIGEEYLKNEVRRKGKYRQCSYCNRGGRSYTIEDFAERVETAFEQHFRQTSDQPTSWQQSLLSDQECNYDWERDGEPVVWAIANATEIPEQAAQDIQSILDDKHSDFDAAVMGEETEFCSESYYVEKGPNDDEWQGKWFSLEQSLKTEARFFSRNSAADLATIFDGIDKMYTSDKRTLVINAGPKTTVTEIFRARVFQSEEKLLEALCRPDYHLGPPPAAFAIAGRMNARGISVFYGANNPSLTIAEVRPPVGSQVLVARFEIVRPLKLLDLTALNAVTEIGSVFDPSWADRLDRATFLRSICQRMTRPVMPDDEAFEYIPTQAVADFLATENDPVLDGIVFPSVQVAGDGLNIVLFHKAARVEAIELPEKTNIEASTGLMGEDGWEADYSVTEWIPRIKPVEKVAENDLPFISTLSSDSTYSYSGDFRDITLKIDLKSVRVHIVDKVRFDTFSHDVRRNRWERNGINF